MVWSRFFSKIYGVDKGINNNLVKYDIVESTCSVGLFVHYLYQFIIGRNLLIISGNISVESGRNKIERSCWTQII